MLSPDLTLTPAQLAEELEELANPNATEAAAKRPNLPGYITPSIEILYYPERPNLFDGFNVSGRAWGSELQGVFVYVTIAGVTRRAKIVDDLWTAHFEDASLPQHYSGRKEIVAQFRDNMGQAARASVSVYADEFVDSFIIIDEFHKVCGEGADAEIHISGELNIGTHHEGRELIVGLVPEDPDTHEPSCTAPRPGCPAPFAVCAAVEPGWQHGEWVAHIPLTWVKQPGAFRVRAELLDCANAALTRSMTSPHVILL